MKTLKILALACFLGVSTFALDMPSNGGPINNRATNKTMVASKAVEGHKIGKIMIPIKYRVKKGEGFLSIFRRYGVTEKEIRKLNPNLVNRKNKNPLLRGEVINIPVYRIEKGPVTDPGQVVVGKRFFGNKKNEDKLPNFIAVNPKDFWVLEQKAGAWEEKNKEIEELRHARDINGEWLSTLAVLLTLLTAIVLRLGWEVLKFRKENATLTKRLKDLNKNNLSMPRVSTDFIKLLRLANGHTLSSIVSEPLVYDEVGNPVTIKKIIDFLDKRPYLSYLPAKDWAETMVAHTQQVS